jgi:hypothetical protein
MSYHTISFQYVLTQTYFTKKLYMTITSSTSRSTHNCKPKASFNGDFMKSFMVLKIINFANVVMRENVRVS